MFMDTVLISSILFFSFLFFFSSNYTFAMDNECSISKCGDDHVVVKFPFRLTHNQHPNCGYPGFDLSCHPLGKTVIQLPSSGGIFFVSAIDYVKQEIRIHDPENCLPRRLLSFNLSGSPFQGIQGHQDYTFLNCSSDYTTTKISPIPCLSSSTNNVFVTTSLALAGSISTDCEIIDSISVPIVPQKLQNGTGFSSKLDDDLVLSWKEPKCSKCDEPGWGCKHSTNDGNGVGCAPDELQNASPKNVPSSYNDGKESFKMALGIVLPAFILTIFLICYMCFWLNLCECDRNRAQNHLHHHHHHHHGDPTVLMVTTVGLDGSTIDSYPMITLGESRRIPAPNDGTCSICLSEYCAKDMVRTIPDCKHCFHAECIDEWLRMNASCPLCRTSPSPLASPLASPITHPIQIHL